MIAVRDSDFLGADDIFAMPPLHWDGASPSDQCYPPSYVDQSLPALARALDAIAEHHDRYDVISNHCLDPLPVRRAASLGVPMVTTLHTPIDSGFAAAGARSGGTGSRFLAVSEYTRDIWSSAGISAQVLPNAVDPRAWPAGPGGDDLVWFGRVVPEKAPHLAVDVARRLRRRLVIAGRVGDERYEREVLRPMLGPDVMCVGELDPVRLADLVGNSAASIATPVWDEPFGLVAPESLMCGTPMVSFAVGGVPEIARDSVGMATVPPGDTAAMADHTRRFIARSDEDSGFRAAIRACALRRFALDVRLAALEQVLTSLADATMDAAGPLVRELAR